MPNSAAQKAAFSQALRGALSSALLVAAALFLVGYVIYNFARENLMTMAREEVLQLARAGAALVDPELHRQVQAAGVTGSAEHMRLIMPLVKFHQALKDVHYVYTAVQVDGEVYFVAGTDHLYRVEGDDLPPDPVMSRYSGNDRELLNVFKDKTAAANQQVVQERFRSYLSAYAPIRAADGTFVAVLGVDMAATQLAQRLATVRQGAVLGAIIGLWFVVWSAWAGFRQRRDSMRNAQLASQLSLAEANAERSATIASLSAGVAHEFSQYLSVIIGRIELAKAELPPDHDVRADLEAADIGIRRALDLIEQMRTMAGASLSHAELMSAEELLLRALRRVQERGLDSERIEVRARSEIKVLCDPPQMSGALFQLLRNALEASSDDKVVVDLDLRKASSELEPLFGRLHSDQEYLVISVSSGGPPLDEPLLQRVGAAFFSTKGEGRGFGLPVIRGAVRAADGALCIDPEVSGNRFSLWLQAQMAIGGRDATSSPPRADREPLDEALETARS